MQRLSRTASRAVAQRNRVSVSPLSTLQESLRIASRETLSSPSPLPLPLSLSLSSSSSPNAPRLYSTTAITRTIASAAAAASAASSDNDYDDDTTAIDRDDAPLFRKVLIANRGEIAIRVARTCRRLGISTVAVYATNDAHSPHVSECDEAFCLGPSYLDPPSILRALEATRADALHPGYGFLSENAGFARAVVEEAGVAWLGPPPKAIVDMGCKLRSKEIARDAGVAIIPGGDDDLDSLEDALELLNKKEEEEEGGNGNGNGTQNQNKLRYPVLLKAAAGGGGKGMRICYNDRELAEGYPLAKSEGLKFFADDRLLLEQYLEDPHHIEFQVVCSKRRDGNENGNGNELVDVAIFVERECSVQRRNQKVVEESPSCLLTEDTRRRMMEQTALLCQSVGYEGAGTVEWLVTSSGKGEENGEDEDSEQRQSFYFLEMNTRLQVEHPITEAVANNTDLVAAMLRVGAGKGLPPDWYEKAEVVPMPAARNANDSNNNNNTSGGGGSSGGNMLVMPWNGHAIEGRIYAEDPLRGYLPSTGPLVPYKEPSHAVAVSDGSGPESSSTSTSSISMSSSSSYLRLDSGVAEGHVVTPFYDPMLSKIISYAPTREEAIDVLCEGLDSYVIEGVNHNARLVQAVLRNPAFRSGDTPTSFLDVHIPDFATYSVRDGDGNGDGNDDDAQPSLLTAKEEEELAVAVALIWKEREKRLGRPPTGGGGTSVVVRPDGMFGTGDAISVELDGANREATVARLAADGSGNRRGTKRLVALGSGGGGGESAVSLDFANHLASVTLDGTTRTLQVLGETVSGSLSVQMCGALYEGCLVQSPREHELAGHMLPPVPEDTSDRVLSPMPGTLIGFSEKVFEGAIVEEGQELCVVEAMKMQNVLRAPRGGTIASLRVEKGAALVTDQVILEYETEGGDDDSVAA